MTHCWRLPVMMIVLISAEHDTFWEINKRENTKLAGLPLAEMAAFVRKHGRPCPIDSTEDVDITIGPADLTDKIEEAELRDEIRSLAVNESP